MTTFVRGAFASLSLSAVALFLVGCGGGGSGTPNPTTTATSTATATPTPTPINTSGPVTTSQLVFVSNRNQNNINLGELFKSSQSGTGAARLSALGKIIDKPSVSPDGTRIVFQFQDGSGATANSEIGIINADGTNFRPLTTDDTSAGRPEDTSPVFSGDGQYIYWTSTRQTSNSDGVPHIFRMRGSVGSEGVSPQIVITEPSSSPSTNSTGNLLAYIANPATAPQVSIRTVSTLNVARVGTIGAANSFFDLALSPDGARVAFSVATNNNTSTINIYNVVANTSATTSLSAGTANGGSAWSRNSQTLFFDAVSGGTRQIFSASAPFSSATPITSGNGDNYSPAFVTG